MQTIADADKELKGGGLFVFFRAAVMSVIYEPESAIHLTK